MLKSCAKKCNALPNTDVSTLNDWPLTSAVTWASAWIRQTERFRSRFTLILPSHSLMPIYKRRAQWHGGRFDASSRNRLCLNPTCARAANHCQRRAPKRPSVTEKQPQRCFVLLVSCLSVTVCYRHDLESLHWKRFTEIVVFIVLLNKFIVKKQIQILSNSHPFALQLISCLSIF